MLVGEHGGGHEHGHLLAVGVNFELARGGQVFFVNPRIEGLYDLEAMINVYYDGVDVRHIDAAFYNGGGQQDIVVVCGKVVDGFLEFFGRFGVAVKEKLKQMKVNIDTLTMSATPIPRTLQFSLMGARGGWL